MNFIKWKILIITCMVCILPVFSGIYLWDVLPDTMAIHFNINNEPDNFASKGFVVFALPVFMMLLQMICCVINDINSKKHGERKKFERATKWLIPAMTLILQTVTFGYNLGMNIDIRKVAAFIVGIIFIIIGNYLPKLDYVKNYDLDTEKARNINRFIGFETVIMGVLSLVCIFLPPIFTVVWLFLLIPYGIISVVYSVKTVKNK